MEDCVFCNIVDRTIASDIIFENDDLMVIRDIMPKAPVHVLIMPKKHITSVNELTEADVSLVGNMVLLAKKIAEDLKVKDSGYRLSFNVGKDGGQTVKHLHMHMRGGKPIPE